MDLKDKSEIYAILLKLHLQVLSNNHKLKR